MAPDDRERDIEDSRASASRTGGGSRTCATTRAPRPAGRGCPRASRRMPRRPSTNAAEVADDLQAAQGEAQQYLDHLRRLQAEFDNYRKRVVKEQTELAELGAMPVARRLLEVLDDFELALMSAEDQPDFDRFLKGVELVYAKLIDALKAEGLERMQAEGDAVRSRAARGSAADGRRRGRSDRGRRACGRGTR